jgi:hypothetical protein
VVCTPKERGEEMARRPRSIGTVVPLDKYGKNARSSGKRPVRHKAWTRDATGKPVGRVFTSAAGAWEWLRMMADNPTDTVAGRVTVEVLYERIERDRRRSGAWRERTARIRREPFERFPISFCRMKVREVEAADIDKALAVIPGQQEWSRHQARVTLSVVFRQAVRERLIPRNPMPKYNP